MDRTRFDELLRQTGTDSRLSRSERQALVQVMAEDRPGPAELARYRSQLHDHARELCHHPLDRDLMTWLEEWSRILASTTTTVPSTAPAAAHFSPGQSCVNAIGELMRGARQIVEICVFTITDDRITHEIMAAHRRGVTVRVISDDEKAEDRGSDIGRIAGAGVPVRIDRSPFHMHHKFALFDRRSVVTGSFNWTRSASEYNHENLVVCADHTLIDRFGAEFERLWQEFTPGT